jgi:transposase
MARKTYPTDPTDAQWKLIEPLLPGAKPGGRPRAVDLRSVLDGILYVVKGGVPWRMLPRDLPPGTQTKQFPDFRALILRLEWSPGENRKVSPFDP